MEYICQSHLDPQTLQAVVLTDVEIQVLNSLEQMLDHVIGACNHLLMITTGLLLVETNVIPMRTVTVATSVVSASTLAMLISSKRLVEDNLVSGLLIKSAVLSPLSHHHSTVKADSLLPKTQSLTGILWLALVFQVAINKVLVTTAVVVLTGTKKALMYQVPQRLNNARTRTLTGMKESSLLLNG